MLLDWRIHLAMNFGEEKDRETIAATQLEYVDWDKVCGGKNLPPAHVH